MQIPPAKRRPRRGFAAVFLVSLLVTLAWQWRGNAYGSEWSGDPDEPAHFVTGLMVHDYIANGLPGPPMAYAKRYYYSYPKVALGHWPPMFYVMQAAWTLLFAPSRISLLLFMATLSALLLTATYALVATFFPPWMAWVSVLFLSTTNDLQASSRMVMAEIPVALFTLLALAGLARYLDSAERVDWRDALWFSGASLAAVLTKGTGIALAPMLFLSVACGRRWRLLRSGAFWLPPLLVAALAAAWYLTAPEALHQKVAMLGGFGVLRRSRIGDAFQYWIFSLGLAGGLLALAGYLRKAWGVAAGTEKRGWWIVIVIFIPVTVACCVLFGTWEVRHLLNTVPLLMLCLCEGLDWVLAKVGRYRQAASVMATAILALTAVRNVVAMPAKTHLGLDLVARDLVSRPEYAKDRFLIVSDAIGEGVFIAEVASREKRPGHIIERGTKVLAEESFLGDRVRLLFTTPEELMRFFEQTPDRVVVLDGIESGEPYLKLVREAIRRYPERWQHLGVYPRAGAPLPLEILRLRDANPANIENGALTCAGRVRLLREVDP